MTSHSKNDSLAHQTLCKFIQVTLSNKCTSTVNLERLILELDCFIAYKPDSIRKWYTALSNCIPFLALDRHRQLWEVIFERFRWDFCKPTLDAYTNFCIKLAMSHPSSIKPILQTCVLNFADRKTAEQKCPSKQSLVQQPICTHTQILSQIEIEEDIRYSCIHSLIKQIHEYRPTITNELLSICIDLFPSTTDTVVECFSRQLLVVISYIPMLTSQMLELMVERMVCLDIELGKQLQQKPDQKHNNENGVAFENKNKNNGEIDVKVSDIEDDIEIIKIAHY